MTEITFVTPVAPEHIDRLQRAVESVNAQTVPCQHIYAIDYDRVGAGAMRNRLLAQVTTRYVSFLDADDWIEPTFAEETLKAMEVGRYVYTDWYEDQTHKHAPNKAWCGGTWHVVTAVVATVDAQRVGGFDETLNGMEDTDFYLKFVTRHICGIRVPKPLMHYSKSGGRSQSIRDTGEIHQLQLELQRRYANTMGCCGNQTIIGKEPINAQQQGDIQAMALWRGNRVQRSSADGSRIYPRGSYPRVYWINPRDLDLQPRLWQRVAMPAREVFVEPDIIERPLESPNSLDSMAKLASQMVGDGVIKPAPKLPKQLASKIEPDINAVLRLAYKDGQ